jgi:hypothetical protein
MLSIIVGMGVLLKLYSILAVVAEMNAGACVGYACEPSKQRDWESRMKESLCSLPVSNTTVGSVRNEGQCHE